MNLRKLVSENRNENSMNLDEMSSLEIVQTMNNEDKKVAFAIQEVLPEIAKVIDKVAQSFENGNRLFYVGAGTSGRIGIMDASECPPTFGVDSSMVIGIMAGGDKAIRFAVENAEDDMDLAVKDLESYKLCKGDSIVGIAASGSTPYVISALQYANSLGCFTAAISSNKDSEIGQIADVAIEPVVGPEVLTGSSRLKSATAQKMICNMITTGSMVKIGKAYQNLMVDVVQTNEKLHRRAENIVIDATGLDRQIARKLIDEADSVCKTAIVMAKANCTKEEALERLKKAKGHTKKALNV